MTALKQDKNDNNANRPRSHKGKMVVTLLLIVALVFFGKSYIGKETKDQVAPPKQPRLPAVVLYSVEKADLAVGREYIGRVEPIQTVSLRPQISGEIEKVHFKEGSMVEAGQLLFTLDDRQYKATVALRKAELAKAEANYDRTLKYDKRLKAADKRSVSASDIELSESDVLQGKAVVEQAKATLQLAEIDLGYARITAPITGRVGKASLTKGNYVTPSSGNLTSIVQTNPIRVTFALPDKDYLDQLQAFEASENPVYDATVKLPNGAEYPLKGTRDFENNEMDLQTGTMTISLRFENPQGSLVPGSMVRVMAKPAQSHIAMIIPQEAVMTDSQGDFVYSVDSGDVVSQSRIKLGDEIGTTYEVTSGLEEKEQIILYGIQSVRPGVKVHPISSTENKSSKTPAESAAESGYDLKTISSGDNSSNGTDSTGGND